MTIEEILSGESKNVEFKENLPEKSIFGIADETGEIVGFDKEDISQKMDEIANAVSDSCEPAIIPDIMLQTVAGKTFIVVEIPEERQRPYYSMLLVKRLADSSFALGEFWLNVTGNTILPMTMPF